MGKWTTNEEILLAEMKVSLKTDIERSPPFPEVVGDRRLIRFLRGCGHDLERTIKTVRNFLEWRRENGVDEIRQNIVYGGRNCPSM